MNKRPLIVFVINASWYLYMHWMDRIQEFQKNGYQIAIITKWDDDQLKDNLKTKGIHCENIEFSRRGTFLIQEIKIFLKLFAIIFRLKPDLVHNITVKPNIYGGVVARLLRIPSISSITGLGAIFSTNGLKYSILRFIILTIYRWINQPHANRVLFENMQDQLLFINKEIIPAYKAIKVPGAGVDISLYTIFPEPKHSEGVIILFAARLLREKGLPNLVKSIEQLKYNGSKVSLWVAGIFDQEAPNAISEDEIIGWQNLGLITWLGKRDDMHKIIPQANIVCLPTTYGEGIPRILIEGAACGRALVATDAPGCNEIIEDGVNGLLAKSGSVESLTSCLRLLVDNESKRKNMGLAGRNKATNAYSNSVVFSIYLETYSKVLNFKHIN